MLKKIKSIALNTIPFATGWYIGAIFITGFDVWRDGVAGPIFCMAGGYFAYRFGRIDA